MRLRVDRNVFELEHNISRAAGHFDVRAEADPRMRRIRHRAVEMPMHAQHLVGIVEGHTLHLHPLASIQQVKPDMSYLDEALSAYSPFLHKCEPSHGYASPAARRSRLKSALGARQRVVAYELG